MLSRNLIRAVHQLVDMDSCPVCDGQRRLNHEFMLDGRVLFRFFCHGSHQMFTLDVEMLKETQIVDAVYEFSRRAFAEEARSPDLRELIAYNRGALPEVRPC